MTKRSLSVVVFLGTLFLAFSDPPPEHLSVSEAGASLETHQTSGCLPIDGDTIPDKCSLYGKIQFVDAFPDVKVQVVDAFPDIKVKLMDAFADGPGKWQIVSAFPDFKVKIVDAFPDYKIKFVEAFPGCD